MGKFFDDRKSGKQQTIGNLKNLNCRPLYVAANLNGEQWTGGNYCEVKKIVFHYIFVFIATIFIEISEPAKIHV